MRGCEQRRANAPPGLAKRDVTSHPMLLIISSSLPELCCMYCNISIWAPQARALVSRITWDIPSFLML